MGDNDAPGISRKELWLAMGLIGALGSGAGLVPSAMSTHDERMAEHLSEAGHPVLLSRVEALEERMASVEQEQKDIAPKMAEIIAKLDNLVEEVKRLREEPGE